MSNLFLFFVRLSPVIFKSTKIAEHILEMPGYFVIMVSNDCCKSFQRSKSCFLGHPVYQVQQQIKNRFGLFLMVYSWTYVHPSYCLSDLLARGFTAARWTSGRSTRPPSRGARPRNCLNLT